MFGNHREITQISPILVLLCLGWFSLSSLQAQVNANFTADATQGCAPLSVRFTDLSTGSIQQWFWDFGNGNTSQFDDVIATYTTPGTYTVSLTVTDTINGISSTRTEVSYITVFSEPVADFGLDQTSGCAPLTVNFTDTSTPGDGTINNYQWDFGDGNLGAVADPAHTYVSAGTYSVTLVVTDDNGCSDTRIRNNVISITNVANVNFSANPRTACTAPFTVSFNSSVSPAGSYTYLWDFGDGNTSAAPDPNHTYTANGDYDVSLTISDINGCQETRTRSNYVIIDNPTADFTALATSTCTGRSISFLNQSTGADSYVWNFGDGNTSTATNPNHSYALPGTYSVSLTANNSAGCDDTEIKLGYITVNPSPAAGFLSNNNIGCQVPAQVSFQDQSVGNILTWSWDFGNGNISSSPNPTTTYTTPGSYTVSLTVTSADGCQSTETINNYVILTEPDAAFTLSDPDGCRPLTVNFLDLSTSPNDPIVNWVWNFGDGTVSNQASPSHTYTTAGQYTVTLTVTTGSGCQNTEVYTFIEVGNRPNADFDANPRIACVNEEISFMDLTTGSVTDWLWYFGDGGTSTDPNPLYTYQDTGVFNVTLIVEHFGCFDTIIKPNFIRIQGAIANFTMTPLTGCNPPRDITFFDQSINANRWFWDFGDGNTSTAQNPVHTYTTVGNFTVTLVATDTVTGCIDDMAQVLPITNPVAGFTGNPLFGCPPMQVDFTNSSLNATSYEWDFGNGEVSNAANPSILYTQPGDYTVTLIASDGVCSDTLVQTSYVRLSGPTIDFSASTINGCAPLPVTFADLSTPYGGSSFVSWQWNFGDGTFGSGPNPTHTYTSPGQYSVTLDLLDSDGCLQSLTKDQYVTATFPTADFVSADTIACPGSFVRFTSTSLGVGITHLWGFGDGSTSTTINPTHLYANNGSYNISLSVTDVNGCTDFIVKNSYINVGQPTAAFVADTTSANCPPLTVNFTNQSSPDVIDWFWDFGDGSTSALANPSKIYAVAGTYSVSLIVTNAQGCKDTLTQPDLIDISGPTGTFSMSPQVGCQPLDVTFSVNSPNPLWTYDWDFGDGTGGTGTTILHTYFVDTTANPLMLIEDENGCVVFMQSPDNIEILPQPRPRFTANQTELCLGQSVTFRNRTYSERPVTNYVWDFGDGNGSTAINPTHVYTDTGTYVVSLQATTVDGCTDTSATPIIIRVTAPPSAIFTRTPNRDCVPAPVSFTQSSTSYFPIVDYAWDFGDGSTDNGATIFPHIYSSSGIFTASLTVTDNKGCVGSTSQLVTVDPLPPVAFSAFQYGCAPITVSFTDETLGATAAVSWLWNFGDGTTSTQQNPNHVYASNGNYSVSLTVTDANGCVNTLTKPDYIQLNRPAANFTSNATVNCPPLSVNFRDLSISDTSLTYQWDFGDGGTSTQANPTHVYYTSDTFDVQLIVTNVFGCKDTLLWPNHVYTHDRPTASFSLSDTAVCVPKNIIMTTTSTASGSPLTSFQWDYGMGSGSGTPTASFLYTNPGTYTLSLRVSDANGCADTAYRNLYIHPNPVANFLAGDTVGCSITTISFTDLSTGVNAPVSWQWTFGDGNTASNQNPSNTYFNDGVYSVRLIVSDINGCRDSLTRTNYISLDHPNADFSSNALSVCPNTSVSFRDLSSGPQAIVSWAWNFGDGSPLVFAQNPSHVYTSPGTYHVRLVVTDALGCQDTLTRNNLITVYASPTAAFSYTPNQGCTPLPVSFTDVSAGNGGGNIIAWNWNFGDGGTAFNQHPSYLYNTAGTYTVNLTVTDNRNCTASQSASVNALETPVVDFIADKRVGCAPEIIQFSDLTTSPFVKVAWAWDFGDGTTSTLPSPSHTYATDGTYTVRLRVTDQNGCTDSVTKTNYIRLSHPVADFTRNQSIVCPNNPIGLQFNDATVADTTLTNWMWTFGDGSSSTLQHPNHVYSAPGSYTVSLTVTNLLGCTDTETKATIITVRNAPTPQFSVNDSINCTPLSTTFTDLSTPGDAALTSWSWNFGNGTSSLSQNPNRVFGTPGTYNVVLTVTDANGCQASTQRPVTALPLPVADFSSDDTLGCAPQAVQFVNTSTGAYNINYYKWYFGDGDSLEFSANPVHSYLADGNYDVTLIATDENGCTDTETKTQYIRLSHPVAGFSSNVSQVCPGVPVGVTFTDTSVPDTTLSTWAWNFGDGSTSNQQNPSHSYSVPGSYTVSLTVTNVLGCSDTYTVSNNISVLNPPVAAFTPSTMADCKPMAVSFTESATGGSSAIVNWEWDFDDGSTSLARNPNHLFSNAGTYDVELTVTDGNGCRDSVTVRVTSHELPVANFVSADTVGCAQQTVNFTDLSNANGGMAITSWTWSFGDGTTSAVRNPSHTYNADGLYDVQLIVRNSLGCADTLLRTAYVRLTRPVVDFTLSSYLVCPGTTVRFSDISTPDTTITNWFWDFGDGATSTQPNPDHIYTTSGAYTVSLTLTNLLNCSATETKVNVITVQEKPTAQFTTNPNAGCMPLAVNFTNTSTSGSSPVAGWTWNFGDGTGSTQISPAHTFVQAGTYPVQLVATNALGCTDTVTSPVTAYALPTAAFTAGDSVGCAPTNITFLNQSTGGVVITSWAWDFGDGGTATSPVPVHSYASDGVYDVQLIVTDLNGCSDTLRKPQHIRLSHPVANFTSSQNQTCPGTQVNFADTSVPDTTLMSWSWNFGDGTTSNLQNPSHFYAAAGTYTISLTVTNVLGCSDVMTKATPITILPPPTAEFVVADSIDCTPFAASFTDASVGNSSPIVAWAWDFGDGQSSAFKDPDHTYLTPGTYTVSLTVTDNLGCTQTTSKEVTATTPPVAKFIASDTTGCQGVIDFFDLSSSSYPLSSWKWYFGDGDSASTQSPSHFYGATGTYDVTLIIEDQVGCSDTLFKPAYINITRPVADFTASQTAVCPGSTVQFTDASVPDFPLVRWRWDFGDGNTSQQRNPGNLFVNPGSYTVQLIVENSRGCFDTTSQVITVYTPPTALYSLSTPSGCEPLSVVFSDLSTGASAPVVSWNWDFGDGSTASVKSPAHTFSTLGTYPVQLTVTDANGCTGQFSQTVTVHAEPSIDFFANQRRGCAPFSVKFTPSQLSGNPLSAYRWDFGDGTTSNNVSPTHTYNADGLYTVRLTVTDVNGCSAAQEKVEYIKLTHPTARFLYQPDVACPDTRVIFRNQSIPDTTIVSYLWDLGDGTTATTPNVDHFYANPGLYTVSLTVTNVMGCSDTRTVVDAIRILTPPVANFNLSTQAGCAPLNVQMVNTSAPGDTTVASLLWNFGNGTTSTQPNPSRTFTLPGRYNVSLTATDLNGCTNTRTRQVEVFRNPQVDFGASDSLGCAPKTIQFVDQTQTQANIVSWLWDFGDGNTASTAFPSHTYNADGVYTVSLSVVDANGCANSFTKPQYIRLSHPVANFQMDQTIVCPGTQVNFSDLSVPDTTLISWRWDFGDGGSSTQRNPGHVYTSSGVYTVSLTVRNVLGCEDTRVLVDTITIRPTPTAQFSPSVPSGCAPLSVNFSNTTLANGSPVVTYTWDFDNGNISNFVNPSQTFTTAANYQVRLRATDTYGCTDTTNRTIRVFRNPIAGFLASDSVGCAPETLTFLDQSQPTDAPIASWQWAFGDGSNSTLQFPNHSYPNDGVYSVELQIQDANGCADTLLKPQYIQLSHPMANFTKSANQICPGTIVSFVDQSVPDTTLMAWLWNFGDGTSSTDQHPDHIYTNGGSYTVSLTVTNVLGCSHTVSQTNFVDILTPPTSQFAPSVLSGCTPLSVSFSDLSTGNSAPIVSWLWDFGDGGTSTAANPGHIFLNPGTYTVNLTTTDNNGCSASHSQSIVSHSLPTANFFTVDTLGCAPHTASFSDLSSGSQNIVGWAWDFGDGTTSTAQFPTHTYANDGLYTVRLAITDGNGCQDTLTRPDYIHLRNPKAQFTLDQPNGCPGLLVNFTDTSIPDTTLVGWFWTFGDGSTSSVQNPSHVYKSAGLFDVSLRITNVLGCSQTLTVVNAVSVSTPPDARFMLADTLNCAPFALDIQDNSVAVSAPIISWFWDFGDGNTSTLQEPNHVYFVPGTYKVSLTVQDGLGCVDTVSRTVVATDFPRADFVSADTIGCAPMTADFRDLSGGDYPVVSWIWNFGDGTTSTQRNPSHVYLQDGVYTVRLIVFDQNGCSDTLIKPDYVRLSHPTANFSADQRTGCEGLPVNFSSSSIADTTLIAWQWSFGDGSTSVQQNPSHTYHQWGNYDVSLVVTNILGCQDTIIRPAYINVSRPPVAQFRASDTTNCGPFQVSLTDLSTSTFGISQWRWFVNDTLLSNSQNASYFADYYGDHVAKLVITDSKGCMDTTMITLTVHDFPVVDFVASDTIGCAHMTTSFTDLSFPEPVSWHWSFGDGDTATDQNPVHTYPKDGFYTVKLAVSDQNGCSSERTKLNYIKLEHPQTMFVADYVASCPPVNATFTASSSGQAGISKWTWDFGDGNFGTSLSPTIGYVYQNAGTYDVRLTVTDSLGCTASFTLPNAVRVLDNILPEPVQIQAVSVLDDQSVEIRHESFKGTDFSYYTLYREEPGLGYIPVGTSLYINDTIWVDENLNTRENSYCYKVTITNKCGTEANLNLVRNHCTINATATTRPSEVVLDWTPYIGWLQVGQYEIYKVNDYNPVLAEFVGVVPGTITRYVEKTEDCFNEVTYRVKAIGLEDLQVSWSDSTQTQGENGVFGRQTEVVRATVQNNEEILVEWKDFQNDNVRIVYVEKSLDGVGYQTVATLPASRLQFKDTDVDVHSNSYQYRIQAQDSCGNVTPLSNIGKTIHLTVDKDNKTNFLQWSAYEDWKFGVEGYRIEIYNDTLARWEMLDIVQGTVTSFLDEISTLKQPRFCYRIVAIELGGNGAESMSNEVCVKVENGVYSANAFTPNLDGINDVFYLRGVNVLTFNLKIYSRWGVLLFETNNIDEGWDGNYKGEMMPEGVYMYVARGRNFDGSPYVLKGSVSLYR